MSYRSIVALVVAAAALVLLGCPMPGSAPAAPMLLDGTAVSSSAIDLTWFDMSDDEVGFRVERSTGGTFQDVATLGKDITAWTDAGLTGSTAYTYRVCAYNRRGESPSSNTVTITTLAAPPAAPTGLGATATVASRIDLSWTDKSANETGFRIQRSTDGSTWSTLTTLGVNANFYSNTGLPSGQKYYYRVCAYSGAGDSAYSNVASATVLSLPAAPSGLTAAVFSATQVNLAWTDNAGNETGFRIECSTNGGGWTPIATPSANATTYSNTGLSAGNTYGYRICATNSLGDSAFSNTATVIFTLPAAPSGLTAAAISSTRIDLAWTDNSSNETGFEIERSSNGGGTWTLITTAGANATTYSNAAGLAIGSTYTYRVRATNSIGDSTDSNTAIIAFLKPGTPSGLTATAISATRIDLAWTDNANNETGFKIERRANGGAWSQITTTAANATSFVNSTGLSAGNTYDYQVRAYNAVGDSTYSGMATVVFKVPTAPSGLTATGASTTQVSLSWIDNANNETAFDVERSPNGTGSWSALTTTSANTVTFTNSGLPAGARYYYRVKARNLIGSSAYSATASGASLPPAQAFKVANSWGVGFTNEKVPDGFYYITYGAFKAVSMYTVFMDDLSAYTPKLIVTLQMSHVRRGDCCVQVGVGPHSSTTLKTFNAAAWYWGDANPFPSNVMVLDITEFLGAARTNNLFLKVYDATAAEGGSADVGSITSFKVEQYTTSYGGIPAKTIAGTGMPKSTVDGGFVYVDVATAGNLLAGTPLAMAAPSRISSLVNAHPITAEELAAWKRSVGVAEKGKNYNKVIGGYGTGLRPPTAEEWDELGRTTMVIDSLKADKLGAPPSVDLSASTAFPPIGSQGDVGSCVAWSMGYYVKTFQEALEHGWNLSTVKAIGSYPNPTSPDSQLSHIMSPYWIYNQINGGVDGGSAYVDAADLIFNLGAASWNTVSSSGLDCISWPSEAGYREAPLYRGAKPADTEWGMHYVLNVTTDAQIAILKTLLANNIPVSISVDASKYANLTSDDVWDTTTYVSPVTNHANTLVGYRD